MLKTILQKLGLTSTPNTPVPPDTPVEPKPGPTPSHIREALFNQAKKAATSHDELLLRIAEDLYQSTLTTSQNNELLVRAWDAAAEEALQNHDLTQIEVEAPQRYLDRFDVFTTEGLELKTVRRTLIKALQQIATLSNA